MRDRQVRFFFEGSWDQLRRAHKQPRQLADLALSVVTADQPVIQTKELGQFVHLKTVACSDYQRVASLLKFVEDRYKKWHMGGIVQIDPDLSCTTGSVGAQRAGTAHAEWEP